MFEAGYGSVSRFYEKPHLGMTARDYRASGKGQRIALLLLPLAAGHRADRGDEQGAVLGEARRRRRATEATCWPRSSARRSWCKSELHELKAKILAFIEGEASLARLPLDIRGTVFQRRVWDELRRIPRGETRTYREIARAIGAPDAVRAVGSACGANPVALVVPCHRAVRTDGGLGGYAWGLRARRSCSRWKRNPSAGLSFPRRREP